MQPLIIQLDLGTIVIRIISVLVTTRQRIVARHLLVILELGVQDGCTVISLALIQLRVQNVVVREV